MRRVRFTVEVECRDEGHGTVVTTAIVRCDAHGDAVGLNRWANPGSLRPSSGFPIDAVTFDAVRRAIGDATIDLMRQARLPEDGR